MPEEHGGTSAWSDYADVALNRLVALQRAARAASTAEHDGAAMPTVDALAARLAPELDVARRRFLDSLRHEGSGFGALAVNARLTEAECELVAFAVAIELDVGRQRLLGYLQDEPSRTNLFLHTVALLLGGLERCPEAIGPDSRVRRAALLDVSEHGPWAQQTVEVPASLVWAFVGDVSADPGLPHGTTTAEIDHDDGSQLVLVSGPDRVRRREAAMAATAGTTFMVVPVPADDRGWAAVVREATLTGRGVVVELEGSLPREGRRWIERADHLAWAVSAPMALEISELPDRPFREIEAPSSELTDGEWGAAFGIDTPRTHRLSPQQAELVGKVYEAHDHDIDASVRRLLAGRLEVLAQRIRPRRSWDDLVLTVSRREQLQSIVSRYRHASEVYDRWGFSPVPSRGLVALFSGPSGTGKTLAAEILAGELGLDMFKLDLSAVVSKYIGETEKNLDQVFDAAGIGNVVLFFDEADALFGKRSEVKDARDRYANIEVSYLLQRIERFDGVVVLATNFEKSIDEAFLRRIHTRIDFVLPAADERLAIWRRHLPPAAPVEGLDLDWLSQHFELTGGQIRNASVHAAFLAADAATPITMPLVVRAVAQELRKAGRLLKPGEFGEWYAVIST
jgi:hypothetical protein